MNNTLEAFEEWAEKNGWFHVESTMSSSIKQHTWISLAGRVICLETLEDEIMSAENVTSCRVE